MPSACPECGTALEYTVHSSRVRTGSCPSCGLAFTIVTDRIPSAGGDGPGGPATAEATDTAETAAVVVDGPACSDCGSALAFEATEDGNLLGVCASCDSEVVFAPRGAEPPRPPRDRESMDDRPRRGRDGSFSGPPARPCRQCGAPLRFSTNEDGTITGECTSCGNRFTLPPRRDRDQRSERGGFRGGRGDRPSGFRPRNRPFGGRPNYRRFGGRGDRPERSDDTRRRRRSRDE